MNEGTPATDKKIFMEKPKTLVNNLLIVGWLISPENKNMHQRNLLGWHGLYEMVIILLPELNFFFVISSRLLAERQTAATAARAHCKRLYLQRQ